MTVPASIFGAVKTGQNFIATNKSFLGEMVTLQRTENDGQVTQNCFKDELERLYGLVSISEKLATKLGGPESW